MVQYICTLFCLVFVCDHMSHSFCIFSGMVLISNVMVHFLNTPIPQKIF
uniref:Uncharacterized protein n=1 Tax=Daphnia magna TaxID=35525 RepID=A0A0P5QPS7_9CRUS